MVSHWVSEVVQLAEFALTQPQACYAAYTFGLKQRWTYFLRTLPDIRDLLEPLENAISQVLIPAITEHRCKQLDRDVLALPVRLGGLVLGNPSRESLVVSTPHQSKSQRPSWRISYLKRTNYQTSPLSGRHNKQSKAAEELKDTAERIRESTPPKIKRVLDLTTEKGSSMWLTILPRSPLNISVASAFKDEH